MQGVSVRIGGQPVKKTVGARSKETVRRVGKELADIENRLSWNLVKESFRTQRLAWRTKCRNADTASLLGQCLKELLSVCCLSLVASLLLGLGGNGSCCHASVSSVCRREECTLA